jgi:hypothetical protein
MNRYQSVVVAGTLALAAGVQGQTDFTFNTDPFTTPEIFISGFDVSQDRFVLDVSVFPGVSETLSFANGLAADLPTSPLNVVVLQNSDDDNNAATAFNARSAARLIAGANGDSGPGFFVYFNSGLNLNRLVFSSDLSNGEAALDILFRISNPTGQDAIAALPTFSASNFVLVPAPGAVGVLAGAGLLAARRRR